MIAVGFMPKTLKRSFTHAQRLPCFLRTIAIIYRSETVVDVKLLPITISIVGKNTFSTIGCYVFFSISANTTVAFLRNIILCKYLIVSAKSLFSMVLQRGFQCYILLMGIVYMA